MNKQEHLTAADRFSGLADSTVERCYGMVSTADNDFDAFVQIGQVQALNAIAQALMALSASDDY